MKPDEETCNHPGCDKPVGRHQWGCDDHWWALPSNDRALIYSSQILNTPVDPAIAQRGA